MITTFDEDMLWFVQKKEKNIGVRHVGTYRRLLQIIHTSHVTHYGVRLIIEKWILRNG